MQLCESEKQEKSFVVSSIGIIIKQVCIAAVMKYDQKDFPAQWERLFAGKLLQLSVIFMLCIVLYF